MPNPTSKLNLVINGVTTQLDIHDANAVDLTNNQTVGGNKEFTGTTTAHDLVPSATDTYNFGSPSYQWNNAYIKSLTINGVACGDILTHNVSEFVDVTTAQTIVGVKSFKDTIVRNVGNFTAGVAPTAQTSCLVLKHTNNDSTHSANTILSYMFTTGETMCELTQNPCIGSTARTWFRTNTDGSYSIYSYTKNGFLGTSAYKWKDVQTEKINGLNPCALSLPSNSYVNVDTTGFDVTKTTIGTFASTVDGWAILSMSQKNKPFGIWLIGGAVRATFYSVHNNDDYFIFALIPVRANINMNIYCTADDIDSTRKVDWLRLFPCQGNV